MFKMTNHRLDYLIINDMELERDGDVIYLMKKREVEGEIEEYYKPNRTVLDMLKIMAFLNTHCINLCKIELPALAYIIRKYIIKKASRAWAKNLALFLFDLRDFNLKGELFNLPLSVTNNINNLKGPGV